MRQGTTTIQNPDSKIRSQATVLGCRIDRVGMEEALRMAEGFIADGGAHQIVTADASMLVMAADDGELKELINTSDLVVPDSTGVVWACHKMKQPVPERVAGVDLMEALCERGAKHGWTAYFLGAAPGVAEEAARKLEARFPGFKVVGTHNGFLKPGDDEAIEEEIRALRPQLLFVAMGIPRQEKWIRQRMNGLGVPVCVGVGGSLDCHSGRVKRAPKVFQRLHIEWLYRLVSNPSKYKKVALLPHFALMVLRSK
jgi:N-acetylglucosaminyldiphosphoundecaprenol N-acetyl-beta-D-mannosaminyltransferase